MPLQESLRQVDHFGVIPPGSIFDPNGEVITSFHGGRCWLGFGRTRQIFTRFIHTWGRSVKGQLCQSNPGFRGALVLGKVAQKILQ